MKARSLWTLISFCIVLAFVACDDDLNGVGGTIQPPSDSISVAPDTIFINAKTVSMKDSVYARTINGVLGKYEDDLFGTIKSDYLCQFYSPGDVKFKGIDHVIDSAHFAIDFTKFSGDSLAPMGLSVYEVTKPLVENFYTNVDPSKYYNKKDILAQEAYTIDGAKVVATSNNIKQREIIADLGVPFGKKIYNAYKDGTIKDNESFNNFFKGVYVTTTFGSGSLIHVASTSIDIYYKYTDVKGNHDKTKDTIRTATFSLSVTPEIIQLNHIQNTNPDELFIEGTGATYMKTPAGVCTEVVFPIKEISDNMAKNNLKNVLSAQFSLKGYTEKESDSKLALERPTYFLMIDKDSINTFFSKRKLPDGKTSFVTTRNAAYNTYNFANVATLVNHYKEAKIDNPTFVILPVDVATENKTTVAVYNYLKPSTAVLRSDDKSMQMELIYSRFANK